MVSRAFFSHLTVRVLFVVLSLLGPTAGAQAQAQACFLFERQTLRATEGLGQNQFGARLALEGNVAVVSDYQYPLTGDQFGSISIFHHDGGRWNFQQMLMADPPQAGARFGYSVAINDGRIFVGAPLHRELGVQVGAVYEFVFDGLRWAQRRRILQPEGVAGTSFGESVAVHGSTMVIGAPEDSTAAAIAGAAHAFELIGDSWQATQKLVADDAVLNSFFGRCVVLDDTDLLVNCIQGSTEDVPRCGTVYAFKRVAGAWAQTEEIAAAMPYPYTYYGSSLALEDDLLLIGHSQAGADHHGQVDLLTQRDGAWTHEQSLTADVPLANSAFGCSIDVSGDTIVVGAVGETLSVRVGGAYVFEREGSRWTQRHHLRLHSLGYGHQFSTLGDAVAISPEHLLVGASLSFPSSSGGAVYAFDRDPSDCNNNEVPDYCEPQDCNGNGRADWCEIADGSAHDCDGNEIPDECEAGFQYWLDNDAVIGYVGSGAGIVGADLLWLNQFNVLPGRRMIDHLAMPRSPFFRNGESITFLVYDDPNNDGDPADAVLLTAVTVPFIVGPVPTLHPPYMLVPIPPTVVGEPGESFFIGALTTCRSPDSVAAFDTDADTSDRSWYMQSGPGRLQYADLSQNSKSPQLVSGFDWMLRALALDCNANGAWDDCDLADGTSVDANGNGIPDECETPMIPCVADLAPPGSPPGTPAGDGTVNVDDLLAVINAWGPCTNPTPGNCPADIAPVGGNDLVNVDDLLAVINAWGACP